MHIIFLSKTLVGICRKYLTSIFYLSLAHVLTINSHTTSLKQGGLVSLETELES